MTLAASWALQQAMHAALVGDAALSALVGGRIYDRAPDDVAFPYVTLGDTEVLAAGTGSADAARHRLELAVWSRATGRREAKEIMSAVHAVLHEAAWPLAGHVLVDCRFERASLSYAGEADALRGLMRFRAYTETPA